MIVLFAIVGAIELADRVGVSMNLPQAVSRHLTTNFVNPEQDWALKWLPVCVAIIDRYKSGDHDLSYGVPIPGKPDKAPVLVESIAEDLHLEPFMEVGG